MNTTNVKTTMTSEELENYFSEDDNKEVVPVVKDEVVEKHEEVKALSFDDLYEESLESVKLKTTDNTEFNNSSNEKDLLLKQIEFFKTKNYLPENFTLPENEELNQALFGEVLEYSTEYLKEKIYEEAIESTGRQGKAIIEYINNGGDAEKIIDLFKNQQEVQFANTETIEGQKKLVREFYKDLDWSEDDIDDFIDVKINSDKLQKEAERIKSKQDVEYDKKISKELENQQNQKLKELQIVNNRKTKLVESLKDDYKQNDIKNIISYVYDENPDNSLTNFELKILDIQKKPNELKELVEYLINPEKFILKKATTLQNKKVETTWSKINTATSKKAENPKQSLDTTSRSWIFD